MMPGQNGYELTKDIKKEMDTPIILLTAKGEVEDRIKGLEIGADDYLGKPFEPKELLLRIQNIITKSKQIDTNKQHRIGSSIVNLNKMIIDLNGKIKKINMSEKKYYMKCSLNQVSPSLEKKLELFLVLIKKGRLM